MRPQEPVTADAFGAARALDLFLLGCQSRVVGESSCTYVYVYSGNPRWTAAWNDVACVAAAFRRSAPATTLTENLPPALAGTTNLNLRSSRAHAIFSLLLTRRPRSERGVSYASKLHVVDLAGSERCKRTKAEGARMREAISINSGLLVLQKVCVRSAGGRSRSLAPAHAVVSAHAAGRSICSASMTALHLLTVYAAADQSAARFLIPPPGDGGAAGQQPAGRRRPRSRALPREPPHAPAAGGWAAACMHAWLYDIVIAACTKNCSAVCNL